MILMIGCVGHICSKICVSLVHVNHRGKGHWDQARVCQGHGRCLHGGPEGGGEARAGLVSSSTTVKPIFRGLFCPPGVGTCVKNLIRYI